ncbi:hypothetical protein [Bremerella cremea]|uniref:hypothetical protein n=1 Tax=Bremerella cremea TaxID=1031537 RepID=UPI0031ED33D8
MATALRGHGLRREAFKSWKRYPPINLHLTSHWPDGPWHTYDAKRTLAVASAILRSLFR